MQSVEVVDWATRAIAIGIDIESGDRVTFALPKAAAALVRRALLDAERPVVEVSPLEILLATSVDTTQ